MTAPPAEADVLIVGAGIAGLTCARHLLSAGIPATLIDADDDLGGRVRTDTLDGPGGTYRLDRGFQVFLPVYPEPAGLLDLTRLDLRPFVRGALIRIGNTWARLSDPRTDTSLPHRLATAFSPAATWGDRLWASRHLLPLLTAQPLPPVIGTAREWLHQCGFSDRMYRSFWQPFLGGVLLDRSLSAPADFVRFTLRMFAAGGAALPARGIGEIPRQLAAPLPRDRLLLGARAVAVEPGRVLLADGRTLRGRATVVATDAPAARRLLPAQPLPPSPRHTTCLYFAANHPPIAEPILLLSGDADGPVNHAAVLSAVAPDLAPPGKSLISLSTVGPLTTPLDDLIRQARAQMGRWFGPAAADWHFLRAYPIPHALPAVHAAQTSPEIAPGLYLAGDHTHAPSLNGAMASGRLAAHAVQAFLARA